MASVKVKGELIDKGMNTEFLLSAYPKKCAKKIERKAIREAAKHLKTVVVAYCPVDDGHLEKSFVVRKHPKAKRGEIKDAVMVNVEKLEKLSGTDYNYAAALEYGRRNQQPEKFMADAAAVAWPQVRRIYHATINKIVFSEAKK
jgi:HK97 gp10 family phage protein